jgi:hypothetical protein
MEATSSRNRPTKHTVKEKLEQRIGDVDGTRQCLSLDWRKKKAIDTIHMAVLFLSGLIPKSRMLPLFLSYPIIL